MPYYPSPFQFGPDYVISEDSGNVLRIYYQGAIILSLNGPAGAGSMTIGAGAITRYAQILTTQKGVAPIFGVDNRSGITAADGAPITLYSVPVTANQLFDAAIEIDATAFTSGTATYTMTYTENGVSQTIPVLATAINVVSGVRRLIQPDPSTLITVQLTGAFVATLRLSSFVSQVAP